MNADVPGSLAWWAAFWSAATAIATMLAALAAGFAAVAASAAAVASSISLIYLRRQTTELSTQIAEATRERAQSEQERVERIEFGLTPIIALEGGDVADLDGGIGRASWKAHLQGEGFAHNFVVHFVTASEMPIAQFTLFEFRRGPGEYPGQIDLPVRDMARLGDMSVRIEARYENAFKQVVEFSQSGRVRIEAKKLEFTSGAPEYKWPWTSIRPTGAGERAPA